MRQALQTQTFIRFALGACLVWFLWAILKPFTAQMGFTFTLDQLGQWGNSFGALNALIAALGFSAIAYTAALQRRTLLSQQKQIQLTLDDQHRQRFESRYIELLRLLREIRDKVSFSHSWDYRTTAHEAIDDDAIYEGTAAFRAAFIEVQNHLWKDLSHEEIARIYEKFVHGRFESNLGPYFRLVYTMLHMLRDDNVLREDEKVRLANLLRSQLTSDELAMHGINGLSAVSKDFGDLLTYFRILKYLPDDARKTLLYPCYPPQTFEGRD